MKIKVKKITVDESIAYKYFKPEFCCKTLKKNPMIVIDSQCPDNYLCRDCQSWECQGCDSMNENEEKFGVFLHTEDEVDDWGDTWPEDYYYPIKFCPFCGEPIEVEVTETTDKTAEAEKVAEVLTKLRKRLWTCDSKKKSAGLEKEIRNLEDIENYYYSTGEIDEDRENQGGTEK